LAALIHKGVVFEDCEPLGAHFSEPLGQWRPGYGSAEYKKRVPMGTIPAVVLLQPAVAGAAGAGAAATPFSLSESATICEWIEDCFPQPPLLPPVAEPNRRAQLRFALRYHDLHINPHVKALFRHCDPRQRDDDALEGTAAQLEDKLRQFDRQVVDPLGGRSLGDEVFDGEAFSLVDCCLPPTLLLMERLTAVLLRRSLLPAGGRLQRWLGVVRTHPTLSAVVAEAADATNAWLVRKQSGDDAAFEKDWWNIGRTSFGTGGGAGVGGLDVTTFGIDSDDEEGQEQEGACGTGGEEPAVEVALAAGIIAAGIRRWHPLSSLLAPAAAVSPASHELAETPSAEESVRCPVCLTSMIDAASLPCGHSGCLGCLLLATAHRVKSQRKCPVCRTEVQDPAALSVNIVLRDHVERLERPNKARAAESTIARRDHAARLADRGLHSYAAAALRRAAAGAPSAELKAECERDVDAMQLAVKDSMRLVLDWRYDFQSKIIKGEVYNYPGHEDGSPISTSTVVSACGNVMTTSSGSKYELGEVSPAFLRSLEQNGVDVAALDMANEPLQCLLLLDEDTRELLAQALPV
jgi:glutathione S-transferase